MFSIEQTKQKEKSKTRVKVLIAEPHGLMRTGLRLLLENLREVEVVGETGMNRGLIGTVLTHCPDVILFGIGMGGTNWLDQISRVIKEAPDVRVIILSTHHGDEFILHGLRAGVSGFLLDDATIKEMSEAFKVVIAGGTYLCRTIDKQTIKNRLKRSKSNSTRNTLTLRQREILELIAEGKTTKEIAFQLKLSTKTIETHRAHMMDRLRIYNIPGLVRYAMRMGLASLDT
jgi:DNA-binding NarL/FixJ family response regulator